MISQVIALGGGGFSMEPDNSALDLYILQQAKSARPRIDGELKRVITTKPLARAYKVAALNGVVEERALECELLPKIAKNSAG